ncbi:MAG: glucuronate isomerase, partial [Bdellovibrionaceae bacterium]|nr:glucuronate isomerase [Pseudobdellovibrionaceae bacterium]
MAEDYTQAGIEGIFNTVRSGNPVPKADVSKFKTAMLYEFGVMDHEKGWTTQYHL